MQYSVSISHHAKKQLRAIPKSDATRILDAIEGFSHELDYFRYDVRKVIDSPKNQPHFRLRVGDYRVIMLIIHHVLIIEVVSVQRKKEGMKY